MSTFADVVNDVWTYLYGFGLERDKETSLASAISDGVTTTIQVTDGSQIDRGYIEIDDEIMGVQSSERNSGIVTLHPWGRGASGTVAETHALGTRVVNNPTFPRTRIKTTINQIISNIYPEVFAIGIDGTNIASPARASYPVNAAAESILSIRVQTLGPSQYWRPVTRFNFDPLANAGSFSTGRNVDIFEAMPPGRPIKIIYRSRFGVFTADTQSFSDVKLLEDYRDLIAIGAEARLLPALDGPRMQLGKMESRALAQFVQPGLASQVAKSLQQTFQARLIDERNRLQRTYPSSIVRMS